MLVKVYLYVYGGALAGRGIYFIAAFKAAHTGLQVIEPYAGIGFGGIVAGAIVFYRNVELLVVALGLHQHGGGPGMLHNIAEELLHNAVNVQLYILRDALVAAIALVIDGEQAAGMNGAAEGLQGGIEVLLGEGIGHEVVRCFADLIAYFLQ